MSQVIRVSESTYNRLESLSKGFDTPGNVIDRLLKFHEDHHTQVVRHVKTQTPIRRELIITIAWKEAGISRDDEIIDSPKAVDSMVISLLSIVEEFGEGIIDKLKTVHVRGLPLIIEGRSKSYHQQKPLGFKNYIVVVHCSNQDKVNIFKKVCICLSLPEHFIKVKIND